MSQDGMQFYCSIYTGLQIDRVQGIHVQDVCMTSEAADSPLQGFMALPQAAPSALPALLLFMLCTVTLGTRQLCSSTKINKARTSDPSPSQSCL
jgi:hypothetical protein